MEMHSLNLNDIVTDMHGVIDHLLGETIELELDLDHELAQAKADRSQIEQALINLIVNARDAMPEGGRLIIHTANVDISPEEAEMHLEGVPGPHVMVAVEDTGEGITPEVMPHLFEPFFTTKEVGKGTGLGLPTVYGIVRQSEGHVEVESEPGAGAIFRIYLPRIAPPEQDGAPAQGERTPLPRGNETILLVEDQEEVRSLTARLLRRLGYSVLEAGDGPEAITLCRENPGAVHLVLTDVIMPEMSGRAFGDRIHTECPQVPILYMSGYSKEALGQHGVLEEGIRLLPKPFNMQQLAETVRAALDGGDV
jgi:CheY-like chemotaxis protein